MNESLINVKIPIKIIMIQARALSDVFKSWN